MEEETKQNNSFRKTKRGNFKWFVVLLIFILIAISIVAVVIIRTKPKNIFDSCYDKCVLIAGVAPNADGTCNNFYHKNKSNLCVSENLEGRCFTRCLGK